MSLFEYIEFAFFFGLLILWNIMAFKGVINPKKVLNSRWGSAWGDASPRGVRCVHIIFLIAGILFICLSLWHLSNGTFKWKGKPTMYRFSDFLK